MKKNLYAAVLVINSCILSATISGIGPMKEKGLRFTENKGQVTDQHYHKRPDVLFSGTDGQLAFHIRNNGISYQLSKEESWKEIVDPKTQVVSKRVEKVTFYRVDVNWLNINKDFVKDFDPVLPGTTDFYLSHCEAGIENVHAYSGVWLRNIYDHINLHYYEKGGSLKYDFVVAPGGDYRQIQLEVDGAKIEPQKDGSLLFKTPLGQITEGIPQVYQHGKTLKARWKINGTRLSFSIENYDPEAELIIDPVARLWGTYMGGTDYDGAHTCVTDAFGNVYVAGYSASATTTLIASSGAHSSTFGGGYIDAFLAKFNSNGVRQWATYYGGSGDETAYGCCVDPSGNVYMCGSTSAGSGTLMASSGAHQTSNGGGDDAFLVKFNSNGVRQWGTFYGGNGSEYGYGCACDPSGNVFMAGKTSPSTGTTIATSAAHQPTYSAGGLSEAFLVKFNSSGVRQWGTYYGGTQHEWGYSCSADASGNVFLAGQTESSSNIATSGAYQTVLGSTSTNAFLAKFDGNGIRLWGTYFGSDQFSLAYSCATDPSGNVYITGQTQGGGPPTWTAIATAGAYQSTLLGSKDAFLVKFNGSGARQWGTFYGDAYYEIGHGCATDTHGDVYLSGQTSSPFPSLASSGAHQSSLGGDNDAFLAKFNGTTGARKWGTFFGGLQNDYGFACTVDVSGNVYLVGNTSSSLSIASAGAFQTAFGGSSGLTDGYVAKFGCPVLTPTISNTNPVCHGSTLNFSVASPATPTVNYSWSGPSSFTSTAKNASIANVQFSHAGVYTLNVDDAGGCAETVTLNITVNPSPTLSAISTPSNAVVCAGQQMTLTGTGATTLAWSGGVVNGVGFNPVVSASFTLTGTGANGCQSNVVRSVTVNPLPVLNTTVSPASANVCFGQSVSLTGAGAPTLSWSGGISNGLNFVPSSSGIYTLTGTDANGCQNVLSRSIVVNPLPALGVVSNPTNGVVCAVQQTTLSGTGASSYTWSGPSTVTNGIGFSIAIPGTYNYTVNGTDANNCQNSATITLTVNALPTVTLNSTPTTATICAGQQLTLAASGTGTLSLSGGISSGVGFVPASSGNYTATAIDANGCQNTAVKGVTVYALPSLTIVSNPVGGAVCTGQLMTLTGTGASIHSWSGGVTNGVGFVPTGSGIYTLSGASANGCQSTATRSITVHVLPTVGALVTPASSVVCAGQQMTLSGTGANNYAWTGPSTISNATGFVPPATGSYTVTGTDLNGCQSTAVKFVTVNPLPVLSISAQPSATVCAGQQMTLTGAGAFNYSWSGGISNGVGFTPLSSGIYTLTGTGVNGCQNTATWSVTVNALPLLSAANGTICSGATFVIIPGGAATYSVNGSTFSVSPLTTTIYTVSGTGSNGCVGATTTTVTVKPSPTVSVNSGTICIGESFTISPTGANTYTISGGTFTVSPTLSANYTVTGTAANGCVSSSGNTVSVVNLPTISAQSSTNTICSGESATVTASGASTYSWSFGTTGSVTVFNPTSTGSHTVTGTDALGCKGSTTISITVKASPTISAQSSASIICAGESATLTATGVASFSWSNGETSPITVVSPTTATTFSLTGMDNGCLAKSIVNVLVHACTGIEQLALGIRGWSSVYPNPTTGGIKIELDKENTVMLFNAHGQIIIEIVLREGTSEIDLSPFAKGIYFLRIGSRSIKVVKD